MYLINRCVFALLQCLCASAYRKYLQPIQPASPNENGVYEFTILVEKKLTMSYAEPPYGHRTLVDFEPSTSTWMARDPNQLVACNKRDPLNLNETQHRAFLDDVLIVDGRHNRVISLNGTMPGPLLVVPFGAEVHVRFQNRLMLDSFSVHFHGIDKQGLWYEDGVAFVQQCPIPTLTDYEYRFYADRAGTHWYHGHLQSDRGDGLVGGFVVQPEDLSVPTLTHTRVTPSREYFTILQDWSNDDSGDTWLSLKEKTMKWMFGTEQMDKCWQPTRLRDGGNVGGATPFSAITFNDRGWYDQFDVQNRAKLLPLETYRIKSGEHILLRLVNGGLAQELMITIEGHPIVIVAADGNEVVPLKVDALVIFPGERYDILIEGLKSPHQKTYHIIAETMQFYFFDWTKIDPIYGIANLEYENAPEDDVTIPPILGHPTCSESTPCTVFNCPFEHFAPEFPFKCIAVDFLRSPFQVNDEELLTAKKFDTGFEEHFINMHYDSHVNGFKFEVPRGMPYYHKHDMDSISSDCKKIDCPLDHDKTDDRCRCFYHIKHKLNNIVQLTIYNLGKGGHIATGYAHPLHIHATQAYIVKMGWPKYNETGFISAGNSDLPCKGPEQICDDLSWTDLNWHNGSLPDMHKTPSLRDTVLIPVGGYVTMRFRATNPGWWFAHCHLELHTMGGAAYAFKIGEDDEIPAPPEDFPHDCGNYYRKQIPEHATRLREARLHEERQKVRVL